MTRLHITPELIERVDRFGVRFNAARFDALLSLPGNPFGVELRRYGAADGIAIKVRHPLLRGKNRIYGCAPGDIGLIGDLLAWYKADGLACTLHFAPQEMNRSLFQSLIGLGLWSTGNGVVPVLVPDEAVPMPVPNVTVRASGPAEKELYLDLFQQAFAARPAESNPEYRMFQWTEDSLPGGARYIAGIEGVPIGMASFIVVDGVGYFGTAGVLPEYRRRGVQAALIRRRILDAPALGCSLLLGSYDPGTTAYRNCERAGLHLIPTGYTWRE